MSNPQALNTEFSSWQEYRLGKYRMGVGCRVITVSPQQVCILGSCGNGGS